MGTIISAALSIIFISLFAATKGKNTELAIFSLVAVTFFAFNIM